MSALACAIEAPNRAANPASGPESLSSEASGRLEALRGFAALQVAGAHSIQAVAFAGGGTPLLAFLERIFNGFAAVTLFFVLSGFVLGLSISRMREGPRELIFVYSLRRFFRIYPTFLVSACVGALLLLLYAAVFSRTPSAWINRYYPVGYTVKQFVLNILFLDHSMNKVTWTLKMEMVCSLMVPFWHLLGKRWAPAPALLLVIALGASVFAPSVVDVLVIPAFLIGYLLPRTKAVVTSLGRYRGLSELIAVSFVILFIGARGWIAEAAIPVEAVSAGVVIAVVAYGRPFWLVWLLDQRFARSIGRVSYSYYLYHAYCLVAISHLLMRGLSWIKPADAPVAYAVSLFGFSSALALLIARFSYAWIEAPVIRWSREWTARWRASRAASQTSRGVISPVREMPAN